MLVGLFLGGVVGVSVGSEVRYCLLCWLMIVMWLVLVVVIVFRNECGFFISLGWLRLVRLIWCVVFCMKLM